MYPQPELIRLAAHKALLQERIARQRADCAAAAAGLARPLAWLDAALAFWRRLSPFMTLAAVPAGLLVSRLVLPRLKILGPLLRWGPLLFNAARSLGSWIRPPAGSASP